MDHWQDRLEVYVTQEMIERAEKKVEEVYDLHIAGKATFEELEKARENYYTIEDRLQAAFKKLNHNEERN
jgi:hypothetical protein